jgi:4-aminobutyrate aminotransferase
MANAAAQGEFLMEGLKELKARYEVIGDVRGKGLMIGVELVKDRETKERHPKLRDEVEVQCFNDGLLVLGCGANTVRISPPLIVDRQQCTTFLEIIENALKRAMKKMVYRG